jgi:hemolysin III
MTTVDGVGGDHGTERPGGALDRGRDAAAEAMERGAEAVASARESAAGAVASAKEKSAEAIARVKPRFRGVSHEWAFFLSVGLGIALVAAAEGARATTAAIVYAASLSALFGVSALYHRVNWRRPEIRRWMRRLDHAMIFFLIAGTVTPFALLVMEPPLSTALLVAVWAGALAGTIVELIWIDAPKWVTTIVYLAVGWIGALGFPAIVIEAGVGAGALIAIGGALYTAGAVVYARQRPDPSPATFGYHEIFHAFVIAAAALHFGAVAFYALPAA